MSKFKRTCQHLGGKKSHISFLWGGKDLNFCVRPQTPITNKSTSEEEKTFGKAP